MIFDITAESTPVLDGWGWDDYWKAPEWKKWHQLMVQKYGKNYANDQFLYWWEQQDSFANPYNWAKYDKNFVNYLAGYGIDISSIISAPLVATHEAVSNVSSAGSKIFKYLGWILLTALLAIVIYVIIKLRSLYKQSNPKTK
jgi:hypothetical protein